MWTVYTSDDTPMKAFEAICDPHHTSRIPLFETQAEARKYAESNIWSAEVCVARLDVCEIHRTRREVEVIER